MLRKTYLMEHKKPYYQMLMLQGKLNKHLNRVDREAHERMEVLVIQIAEKERVTEQLKAEQPMLWVRKMNGIRTTAEEMVLTEIVYG
ncbi:MAG: TnpV protein [Blautia sp.]|nr:TnpV protein [Blautia sp.]